MAKKRKAYITYTKDYDGKEGYTVYFDDYEGNKCFDCFFPLREENFLHWSILRKFTELQTYGYEIIFKC